MRTESAQVIQMPGPANVIVQAMRKEKPKKRPGTAGYKWTPAQRKKFLATAARKQAARFREERAERRQARLGRKAGGAAKAARRPLEGRLEGLTAAPTGRKGKPGPEERLDAIVYLARAYAAYEGIPDEALLGLLALRTLQGRIK